MRTVIFGCGDVGRRIVSQLVKIDVKANTIVGLVNSIASQRKAAQLNVDANMIDLDMALYNEINCCHQANVYYTIAPQKSGVEDLRTNAALAVFESNDITPTKVVLISTTGVYGDCDGEWVNESSETRPQTDRGKRRLSSERQWLEWGAKNKVAVSILRAPGIYANSRIPKSRIEKRIPVVSENECGFTNRIHADDLARACITAMQKAEHGAIYNATDGKPGKISEYLQAAAKVLELPALPEISMQQAQQELSSGMLSYLSESRKISNQKLLTELEFELLYPDFREGLLY